MTDTQARLDAIRAEALEWRQWATGERKKPPHNLLAFTTDVRTMADELERATAALEALRGEAVLEQDAFDD
jgi:hypothetical protein